MRPIYMGFLIALAQLVLSSFFSYLDKKINKTREDNVCPDKQENKCLTDVLQCELPDVEEVGNSPTTDKFTDIKIEIAVEHADKQSIPFTIGMNATLQPASPIKSDT